MNSASSVCILTAGVGSRMGAYSQVTNKALLPLGGKAIISHIIEKFPASTEFVIALGFLGELVETYLKFAHPQTRFQFVKVDNFAGPGSGPGYSLACCQSQLRRPFYFVSCDTLWDEPFDLSGESENWFATAEVPAANSADYCNFRLIDDRIVEILDKVSCSGSDCTSFSGLCYIRDFELFWEALADPKMIQGEPQISNGVRALVESERAWSRPISWLDLGDERKYNAAGSKFEDYNFSKTDEFVYFVGDRVIKFFKDPRVSQKRVDRVAGRTKTFPEILDSRHGFYTYKLVDGQTLYKDNDVQVFGGLLKWLDRELWTPVTVDPEVLQSACSDFYEKKTQQRLVAYYAKYGNEDRALRVNGQEYPKLPALLARVNWQELSQGTPVFFHGDLQFDNILYSRVEKRYRLLDWRQDFSGRLDFGDLYYDLAKLAGGLVLNYDLIKKNIFTYREEGDDVFFDYGQRSSRASFEKILFNYAEQRGLDSTRIRLLTGLIFLNMSPLHHAPFDRLLFNLARKTLSEVLDGAAQ